jgi:hypothetical protein
VKSFNAVESEFFVNYIYDDVYASSSTYKLHILKEGKKLRYSSNPISDATKVFDIKAYPGICQSFIYVDIKTLEWPTTYYINDMNGRLVLNGSLTELYNSLDISKLSNANYILNVIQDNEKKSFKFTKN